MARALSRGLLLCQLLGPAAACGGEREGLLADERPEASRGGLLVPSPTLSHRLATPCPAPHGVCSSSRATRLRGPSSTSGAREFEPPLCHSERPWENETQLSLLLNGGDDPSSFLDSEARRPHPCLVRVPEEGEHPCPLFSSPDPMHLSLPLLCLLPGCLPPSLWAPVQIPPLPGSLL